MVFKWCLWIVDFFMSLAMFSFTIFNNFDQNINFIVTDVDNQKFNWTANTNAFPLANCPTDLPLNFIIPGWQEFVGTSPWIPQLVQNLKTYRGGCVVVVDYYHYSKTTNYAALVLHFSGIADVIKNEMLAFRTSGYSLDNFFVFGFSFGGQLSLKVGRSVKDKTRQKINRMDLCEPTTMGFPANAIWDSTLSGDHLQCIHTNSNGYGTQKRDCHVDWNMGNCGNSQPASGAPPMGSHGLCPYFYVNSFENDFLAIQKPSNCVAVNLPLWPPGFKMGAMMDSFQNQGQFFAATFKNPPYNK